MSRLSSGSDSKQVSNPQVSQHARISVYHINNIRLKSKQFHYHTRLLNSSVECTEQVSDIVHLALNRATRFPIGGKGKYCRRRV